MAYLILKIYIIIIKMSNFVYNHNGHCQLSSSLLLFFIHISVYASHFHMMIMSGLLDSSGFSFSAF